MCEQNEREKTMHGADSGKRLPRNLLGHMHWSKLHKDQLSNTLFFINKYLEGNKIYAIMSEQSTPIVYCHNKILYWSLSCYYLHIIFLKEQYHFLHQILNEALLTRHFTCSPQSLISRIEAYEKGLPENSISKEFSVSTLHTLYWENILRASWFGTTIVWLLVTH